MTKFRRLTSAIATADAGTASGAAAALNMTQPSVTHAIAALEAELDERLFNRSAGGMAPTANASAFFDRVRRAFDRLDSGLQSRRASRPLLHRVTTDTQLTAFIALCETGSYSGAGRKLAVSQPAISRAIRDLEIIVGTDLWRRAGPLGEPTVEGRALARAAGVCLRDIELATDALRETQGRTDGALRIGALPLSRSDWVPGAVIATLKLCPEARVSLVDGPYSEQLIALQHGRIDMIVGALRPEAKSETLSQVALFEDALCIAVRPGHPVLETPDRTAKPDWLAAQTWILPAKGTPGRARFLQYLSTRGLSEPRHTIECGSLVATRALLRGSDFAAPLSRRQIRLELETGLLVAASSDLPGTRRGIGVATRAGFKETGLYRQFMIELTRAGGQHIDPGYSLMSATE